MTDNTGVKPDFVNPNLLVSASPCTRFLFSRENRSNSRVSGAVLLGTSYVTKEEPGAIVPLDASVEVSASRTLPSVRLLLRILRGRPSGRPFCFTRQSSRPHATPTPWRPGGAESHPVLLCLRSSEVRHAAERHLARHRYHQRPSRVHGNRSRQPASQLAGTSRTGDHSY